MKKFFRLSDSEIENTNYNYFLFISLLRFLSIGWLGFQSWLWFHLEPRPGILYEPIHYIDRLLMPEFPSGYYYFSLIITALLINLYLLIRNENIYLKVLLFFLLALINTLKWSYGYFPHVSHTFLLCHFFTIFGPDKKSIKTKDDAFHTARIAQFTYAGILITYTFSGLWKLVGLAYKIILKPNDLNWLHPDAAYLNAISLRRYWDDSLGNFELLYTHNWIWQLLVVCMILFQTFSIVAAFKLKMRMFWCAGIIAFHLHNTIVMHTEFHLAVLVILILLFPYHLFKASRY